MEYLGAWGDVAVWHPNVTFGGTFRGEDTNSDGFIMLDEISSLIVDTPFPPDFVVGCPPAGVDGIGPTDCKFSAFSYQIGGPLTFSAAYQITTGGYPLYEYSFWPEHSITMYPANLGDGYTYSFVDATTFDISSAVPEPSTYAMLLGGLGLISCAARWRKG
ncbi:PEP-CTERM sorting domain-containing protein [Massilia sp. METH4]|uniref:PEP-CTERM sorting domain-containing protein n=1 Tax=Massilia sp. METH4 TaxID=3123041 RepID=UPI0030CEDB03